nr:hypothetical protein [Tanacetum cinerariifolium]
MCALLIQHGCEAALEVLPVDMQAEAKGELNNKAHIVVILCLSNKVLREVTVDMTAVEVWSKLETLYMTKSLANKLCLKKKLYTFYMPVGQKNSEHRDEFNKIFLDLANIEDMMVTLNSKEIKEMSKAKGGNGEGLYDHLKRNCPKNNQKKSTGYIKKDDQPSSNGSIYDSFEVMMKSLHGLKQSLRQWYRRFDEYMLSNGFKRSIYDGYVYYRSYAPSEYIYLLLCVDDMLNTCKSKVEIGSTKSLLKKKFDMKKLGEANKILGMEIVRDRSYKTLRVSQSGFVSKILDNFRVDNGTSINIPLDGHFKLSLKDCPVRDCDVERISEADFEIFIGICKRAISVWDRSWKPCRRNSWKATLQHVVDLSTTEVEYMALTEAVKETIWLSGLLEELGVKLNTVTVNCDNKGAIRLSRNHIFHERTKHINVCYHFIREVLEAKTVEVLKVGTEHNVADALTKVLTILLGVLGVGFSSHLISIKGGEGEGV